MLVLRNWKPSNAKKKQTGSENVVTENAPVDFKYTNIRPQRKEEILVVAKLKTGPLLNVFESKIKCK